MFIWPTTTYKLWYIQNKNQRFRGDLGGVWFPPYRYFIYFQRLTTVVITLDSPMAKRDDVNTSVGEGEPLQPLVWVYNFIHSMITD